MSKRNYEVTMTTEYGTLTVTVKTDSLFRAGDIAHSRVLMALNSKKCSIKVEDAEEKLARQMADKIMAEMSSPLGREADCIIHSTDKHGLCFKCGKRIHEDLDNLTIRP